MKTDSSRKNSKT